MEVARAGEPSAYNWWAHTARCVEDLVAALGVPAETLRAMPRRAFAHTIKAMQWRCEYYERLHVCRNQVRLYDIGREIAMLESAHGFMTRTRWPGAPYQRLVDDRYHVRLLANARLGLLPIEIETGRWVQPVIPAHNRLCALGCGCKGDLAHFLHGCQEIVHDPVDSVYTVRSDGSRRLFPPNMWRGIAVRIARRWYTRMGRLQAEDQAAGDETELDQYVAQLEQHPATYERSDIRAYLSMRQQR